MNKDHTIGALGAILIVAGIGYLGNNMNLWHFSLFFDGWWALVLAIFGLVKIFSAFSGNKTSNLFVWILITLIAIYYFLRAQGWVTFDLEQLIVPLLMIIIGLFLLFPKFTK